MAALLIVLNVLHLFAEIIHILRGRDRRTDNMCNAGYELLRQRYEGQKLDFRTYLRDQMCKEQLRKEMMSRKQKNTYSAETTWKEEING